MKRSAKLAAAGAAALVVVGAGTGIGIAAGSGGDDTESRITGDALDKASAAALEHTGGGRVTDTEVGDEESYYEVEVTLADGTHVDVQLDRDFEVVRDQADGPGEDDHGPGEDDGQDD